MLTFGILYCAIGALEIAASVLSLQSHTGSRQVLDWVLLAAFVMFFFIGVATIVLALLRRRASNRAESTDDNGEWRE
jgi:flagellar biosynthesis/type III secretory pathway M-ring protein FliF/YscJ